MANIGDVFKIPLSDGRRAYGQYVFRDKKMGPLVKIFDLISNEEIEISYVVSRKALFPPVITGVVAAIRTGFWKIVGHARVLDFEYPRFISTLYNQHTGKAGIWYLWDGEKETRIGTILPPEYKSYEYLVVWNPTDITWRIETGEYPYPYGDLIQRNGFIPRELSSPGKN